MLLAAEVLHVAHRRRRVTLVDGLSFEVSHGETVALLGESGSGAVDVIHALLGASPRHTQVRGRLMLDDNDLVSKGRLLRAPARGVDGVGRLSEQIERALAGTGIVALSADGPRGRNADLTDAEVASIVRALRAQRSAAVLIATRDPRLAFAVADRVIVMYGGCTVESGPAYRVLNLPAHPYTRALIDAVPSMEGARPSGLPGAAPVSSAVALQCAFAERCPHTRLTCWWDRPLPRPVAFGHATACARHRQLDLTGPRSYWRPAAVQNRHAPVIETAHDSPLGVEAGELVGVLSGSSVRLPEAVQRFGSDIGLRERRPAGTVLGGALPGDVLRGDHEAMFDLLKLVGVPRKVARQRVRDLPVEQRLAVMLACELALVGGPSATGAAGLDVPLVVDAGWLDWTARPGIAAGLRRLAESGRGAVLVSGSLADLVSTCDRVVTTGTAQQAVEVATAISLTGHSLLDPSVDSPL